MRTLYIDCGMGAAGDMLAAALLELCDDPEKVKGYQDVSADYVTRKYNWNDVTERTLELYR